MEVYMILFITFIFSIQIDFIFAQSSLITNYHSINYEPQHHVVRRSASIFKNDKKINVKFQAFQKNFHLNVFEDYSVLHSNTELIVGNVIKSVSGVIPVKGYLDNYRNSDVYGTMVDGIFRGTINLDINNETSGSYYVEHSGYHFTENPGFHSIIYHDSDINSDHTLPIHGESSHCGWSQSDIAHKMHMQSLNHGLRNYSHKYTHSRSKRSSGGNGTQHVCNLFLQSDTFLWNKVLSLHHVKNEKHLAIQEISSIFTLHVQGAQAIYQNTKFQTFDGRFIYNGIGFRVDRVRINTTSDCKLPLKQTNPFCSPNIDVTNFLNLNSYMRHDDFCLAYVFTYRDFSGGTLGLAWVAEPGVSGGVCEKYRYMQEAGSNVQKSLNTGIVTLLNYGSYVALKVSQLTFAHEIGHNFGSKHDDDHNDHRDCLPSFDDPKGNFIMFASATSGERENNNKFSRCSKDSIARLLDRVIKSPSNCFLQQEGSFCGNKLTEEGEECDCGFSTDDCKDRCCNPKMASSMSCKLTKVITTNTERKKVYCSPNAGECCTNDCQFESNSLMCRYSGECYEAAYCAGNATKCPVSKKKPDLTRCQDKTRVCKNGECVGSVCESVPGWQECSIVRVDSVTAEMMCFVACKQNISNAPCISTYNLQNDAKLQRDHRQLVNALMPDSKGIQLRAGAPCDNFHGYCDIFLRCRSVEADGPMARIKRMIFSSYMLLKVKRWTMQFWWAVMLICIGVIVFVGIFIKVCSKNTPSTNPNVQPQPYRRRRSHRHHQCSHHRRQHRHSDRSRRHRSRHRSQNAVANDVTNDAIGQSEVTQPLTEAPPRPPRQQRPQNRPFSMVQSSIGEGRGQTASNSGSNEAAARPMSMNLESNIQMNVLASSNLPSYPPPAYESSIVLPQQHGHGRGKRGHRHALDRQASLYP